MYTYSTWTLLSLIGAFGLSYSCANCASSIFHYLLCTSIPPEKSISPKKTTTTFSFQLCVILLLKQSDSQPINCSKADLRSLYYLVSKTSIPSPSQNRQHGGQSASSVARCSWTWGTNRDVNRMPMEIAEAYCYAGDDCAKMKHYCKKVVYNMMVLTKSGSDWTFNSVGITVGFVYTKKNC